VRDVRVAGAGVMDNISVAMRPNIVPVPDRISTFRVTACDVLLRCVRYDIADMEWVSPTPGDADGKSSSTVRRFSDKVAATTWLADREQAPAHRRSAA
jgi:hypothetical protein